MFMVRLIYASKISATLTPHDWTKIQESSVRHNEAAAVSGALHFNRKYFLQVLEGSRAAVNETYIRIGRDDRHREVTLLDYCDIDRRSFTEWSMMFLPESKYTRAVVRQFAGKDVFDPYALTGVSAHGLLCTLTKAATG